MFPAAIFNFSEWFSAENYPKTIGFIIAIFCGIIMLTELYTVITQKSSPDLIMMLLGGLFGGLVLGFTADTLLALLVALCWLMIYSVWTTRESPVWRELMLASLISYLVILAGRVIQRAMDMWGAYKGYDLVTYTKLGLTGQQWFGIGWNGFIYVFFLMCIIFFGRRFFLVSRLTSPQIIYLFLFAVSYFVLYQFSNLENLIIYYGGNQTELADRLLFASFGTYEIMICVNVILYLISGPLLHLIFGVKKVTDERVLGLVDEVKQRLGIKGKVRVGYVKAPIQNAFAFGAFFDRRIAFMSNELSDFSDDDIRGIAGHELAHSKRFHTLWLFLITFFTFGITKAIKFPATTLDYIFDPDVGLAFLWYYLYNIALLIFSYLFVRMLEGRADQFTMKAGYGTALAKSLIKLDGFYQGIASEMGLSVYLLTDKKQTPAEKIRFLGDAGRGMYNATINPSKMECLINLIASHPKSAFRVVALTDQEKLRPIKAALLPFLLLVPFVRRKYIKELRESRMKVAKIVNETFIGVHDEKGITAYDQLSHLSYRYKYLKGKDIVAISKIDKKDFLAGQVIDLKLTKDISSPILLEVKTDQDNKLIPLSDYNIFEMAVGQKQLFKNGKFGIIDEMKLDGEKFKFTVIFEEDKESEPKELSIPGVPLSYLQAIEGKEMLLHQKGVTKLAHLETIELSNDGIAESTFTIRVGKQEKSIPGRRFVMQFKPFDVYLDKRKRSQQRKLIDWLKDKAVSLQTKDDLDTLLKCRVNDVKEDSIEVAILDETKEIKLDRLEFLYLFEDTLMLIDKKSLSFIERVIMALQNRKKLAYVIP